jgi:glycogen debranching enzyme
MGAYATAYLRIYQRSGQSFVNRMLLGFETEMSELCIGSLNELYDGNPPFRGHGGMSFAQSVAAIIEMIKESEEIL